MLTHSPACCILPSWPRIEQLAGTPPDGTRMTRPRGGHVLWVELPAGVDTIALYERALRHGVSFAPGPLFSACGGYRSFLRLNCALPWSDAVEGALRTLGRLAAAAI